MSRLHGDQTNKIICYCRTSPLIHSSIPVEFNCQGGTRSNSSPPDLRKLVFEHTSSLMVIKVSSGTSSTFVKDCITKFIAYNGYRVMLIVINMQECTQQVVNHLRIMIEEIENRIPNDDVPKLFVVLLHFSPEMFFQHCYPSYFLSGWDHFYLDSIAPIEQKGIVDLEEWFKHCCIIKGGRPSFLHKPLEELLHELVPILSSQLSYVESSKETDSLKSVGQDDIEHFLLKGQLGSIIISRFCEYWKPKVMQEVLEQAASFAQSFKSTLCITDSVQTMIRCSFQDFVFFILSTMHCERMIAVLSTQLVARALCDVSSEHKNQLSFSKGDKLLVNRLVNKNVLEVVFGDCVGEVPIKDVEIVYDEQTNEQSQRLLLPFQQLCFSYAKTCPVPKTLQHLRFTRATTAKCSDGLFPFLDFIMSTLDQLFNFVRTEVNKKLGITLLGTGASGSVDPEKLHSTMVEVALAQLDNLHASSKVRLCILCTCYPIWPYKYHI